MRRENSGEVGMRGREDEERATGEALASRVLSLC